MEIQLNNQIKIKMKFFLKLLLFLLNLFIVKYSYSQNLVLNPSFEQYNYLPQNHFVNPIIGDFYCANWFVPEWSSPDYYNSDCTSQLFSVPNNLFGFHPARSGKGYVGIVPFYHSGGMEYIIGELSEPLYAGKKYIVTYYVQYCGNSSYFYFSKFGLCFSEKKPHWGVSGVSFLIFSNKRTVADIEYDGDYIKSDTTWTKISGEYIAKGGEKYFTIGMFYQNKYDIEKQTLNFISKHQDNDYNTFSKKEIKYFTKNIDLLLPNILFLPNSEYGQGSAAYYFIDDVSVVLAEENR